VDEDRSEVKVEVEVLVVAEVDEAKMADEDCGYLVRLERDVGPILA
jgi:hypothetical protein